MSGQAVLEGLIGKNEQGAATMSGALFRDLTSRLFGETRLLDLGFLERHMLAHDGIILVEFKLLRRGARILLGHVVEAGISAADQLDLNGICLGHDSPLTSSVEKDGAK
jgi:hypothetical protein